MRIRLLEPRLWGAAIGAFVAVQGLWAFVAPRSFYETLATFEPFNAHFVRDIGAIQVGVGVAGVVGALRVRPVVVGLVSLLVFQVLHVTSHVVDRDAGGRPGFDIPALAAVAALTAIALVVASVKASPGHRRRLAPRRSPHTHATSTADHR